MSEALAKIYAIQQRELNEKERQRQRAIAKTQRILAAFQTSGLVDLFYEMRDIPLRAQIRQTMYKSNIGELCWQNKMAREKLNELCFMSLSGTSSGGPRWWCDENDVGQIRYWYRSGRSYDEETRFAEPAQQWLDYFVEYVAKAAEPEEIEKRLNQIQTAGAPTTRRQIQPI